MAVYMDYAHRVTVTVEVEVAFDYERPDEDLQRVAGEYVRDLIPVGDFARHTPDAWAVTSRKVLPKEADNG